METHQYTTQVFMGKIYVEKEVRPGLIEGLWRSSLALIIAGVIAGALPLVLTDISPWGPESGLALTGVLCGLSVAINSWLPQLARPTGVHLEDQSVVATDAHKAPIDQRGRRVIPLRANPSIRAEERRSRPSAADQARNRAQQKASSDDDIYRHASGDAI